MFGWLFLALFLVAQVLFELAVHDVQARQRVFCSGCCCAAVLSLDGLPTDSQRKRGFCSFVGC
jgi:hypothetical protein